MFVQIPAEPIPLKQCIRRLQSIAKRVPANATLSLYHVGEGDLEACIKVPAPETPLSAWRRLNRPQALRNMGVRKGSAKMRPWSEPADHDYPKMPEGWVA